MQDMHDTSSDPGGVEQNKAEIHSWYDDHAHEFTEADVIEHGFVGKSPQFQERLNRFKLWAVVRNDLVSLVGKHVLEFGAGHGRLAIAYPGMASYTGVDYSKNLVDIGNERLQKAGLSDRARIEHGDVTSFDGPKRHFDVVCSLGMLCYFPDAAPIVTRMELFVKPGGVLFFDFRVASVFYTAIRRVKWAFHPPTGGTTFAEHVSRIEELLTNLGLTNIRVRIREFPFLGEHYARSGSTWPLNLRNALSQSRLLRPFATAVWVFADKPPAA